MVDPVRRIERRSRRAIFQAYLSNARRDKADKAVITDGDGRKLTHKEITKGAFALGGLAGLCAAIAGNIAKDKRRRALYAVAAAAGAALLAAPFGAMTDKPADYEERKAFYTEQALREADATDQASD